MRSEPQIIATDGPEGADEALLAGACRGVSPADVALQRRALAGTSRTFALTIPALPERLELSVGNAYLLCRITDTIEDDAGLTAAQKNELGEQFAAVVSGDLPAAPFAEALAPALYRDTPSAERDLVRDTEAVIRITRSFSPAEQRAVARCVRIMSDGMAEYHARQGLAGLGDVGDLDRYCYYVAGCVGEMLTELFCAYSPAIEARRESLHRLSVSFGQGLQMTNILKDIWDDRERGACWVPRAPFAAAGIDLASLRPGEGGAAFAGVYRELIGLAAGHLRNALRYTLLIPRGETGIRRFCLWAIGMAVLTLRRIHARPNFTDGAEVKISRRAVRATVMATSALAPVGPALQALFNAFASPLPYRELVPPVPPNS